MPFPNAFANPMQHVTPSAGAPEWMLALLGDPAFHGSRLGDDDFDADPRPDGTVLVTLITAKPGKDGKGWRRYANGITIHPKN